MKETAGPGQLGPCALAYPSPGQRWADIFYFLAALGLRCCVRAFSTCGERGLLFAVVRRLPIAVASLVAEHGL